MYILFWKAGDRPKRWLYDNHENQNLLGMTDRETGKGGRSLLNGWSFGQLDPPVLVLVSGSVLYLYLEEGGVVCIYVCIRLRVGSWYLCLSLKSKSTHLNAWWPLQSNSTTHNYQATLIQHAIVFL